MLELGGALGDLDVEDVAQRLEARVEHAHLEEVADAQKDFGWIKGPGEEVRGADGERLAARFLGIIGGDYEDWRHVLHGDAILERLDEIEAGERLHVPVQKKEVGLNGDEFCQSFRGVGNADANGVAGAAENLAERGDVGLAVIDDENAGVSSYMGHRV